MATEIDNQIDRLLVRHKAKTDMIVILRREAERLVLDLQSGLRHDPSSVPERAKDHSPAYPSDGINIPRESFPSSAIYSGLTDFSPPRTVPT